MQRVDDSLITPAGPGDAAALARVHVLAWRQAYAGLLPQDHLAAMEPGRHALRWRRMLGRTGGAEVVMVAETRAGLAGYCEGVVTGAEAAEVFTLYVLAARQGRGLGRRLLATTARVLEARGARRLRLWVLDGNIRARGFYEHLGGQRGERRPVNGWGGGRTETAYAWPDIAVLTDRSPGRPPPP